MAALIGSWNYNIQYNIQVMMKLVLILAVVISVWPLSDFEHSVEGVTNIIADNAVN